MVDLGLYVDGRNPAQWERPWRERYAYLLDLCAEADRAGLHSLWFATPERAAAELRELIADSPARTAYIWATLPGLPEDLARRNIELAATRLAPLLADTSVDPTGPSREEETVIIRRPQ